ncbi:hypothetical protein Tco_1166496 [Tanacetum coccineum]
MAVRCSRNILRQCDCLDRLIEIPWVVLNFVLIEGEDIVAEFCGPSRWKELSKESGSNILLCGDGSCWRSTSKNAILDQRVDLDPQTVVRGMSIHFAPTGWYRIEEIPRCSLREARWYSYRPRGLLWSNLLEYG